MLAVEVSSLVSADWWWWW